MIANIENELGTINIEPEAIAKIAGLATTECYGIVGMASKNMKDGIVKLLKIESLTKGVKLKIEDNKLIIDLHIIVKYGTNIKAVAETIISTVKYKVEEATSMNVSCINIFVEGIKIKD
ncbi:Asp23/Gls24 family envelope stress response protein [[Clostridium] colinum]|uniref:Asp23/Gls24 family envelope stress response protein n=1 Tax=[Clostridium] colinum TaxID=36835 RepID=UPI002023CE10|nr:Asp23/Gls24 family envelope stress response protein [[Clostridium] colinum]